jgi:GTP-binding protein
MTLLDASAVSWAVVITKADKLKPAALDAVCNDTRARITTHVAAFPELFVTSAEAATGIAELRAHIGALALPRS